MKKVIVKKNNIAIRDFEAEESDLEKMLKMEGADVTTDIIDITEEYEAKEKIKKDKKDKREAADLILKDVDFSKINTVKELTAIVKAMYEASK